MLTRGSTWPSTGKAPMTGPEIPARQGPRNPRGDLDQRAETHPAVGGLRHVHLVVAGVHQDQNTRSPTAVIVCLEVSVAGSIPEPPVRLIVASYVWPPSVVRRKKIARMSAASQPSQQV